MYNSALRRYWSVYTVVAFYLLLGLVSRGTLWWQFGGSADVPASVLPALLAGGMVNDFVQSLYLTAPLALYVLLLPDPWYRSRSNRGLMRMAVILGIGLLVYLTIVENYFFEEFDARFNVVAVDYLIYPTEVVGDIWEAYPVVRAALATLALMVLLTWLLSRPLRISHEVSVRWRQRIMPLLPHAAALAIAIVVYPTDALSWSGNRVANELVQNGFSSFFRAAMTNEIDYGAHYATRPMVDNIATLQAHLSHGGGRFTRLPEQRLDRAFTARTDGLGKFNVVVIASESFGAEFSKLYGSKSDLTPEFDRFAQQGMWFSHTYASGTRTVRGLEALTAVFPPIPTVSIVRRPGNEDIATWGKVMRQQGYETSFLYGGYAYFDNMRHFYTSNGFQVADRSDIAHPRFGNIWGVSDEDLFDMAISRFGAEHRAGKPFFSIVMTTSNHKPYTFRSGLESIGVPPSGGGRAAGVRYADHAMGYFLRAAARQPWFDQTLFVVIADHGARVYGKQEIPLKTYEIPLMIYAPKVIKPQRIDTLMSQIDVAPTVLGMLGLAYEAPFFGQDVLHFPDAPRVALFNHNHDVAILEGNSLVVFGLHKRIENYQYDQGSDTYRPAPHNPELENLGIAYFQTASELFRTRRYN